MGSVEREPSNVTVEQVHLDAKNACLCVLERVSALLAEAGDASRRAPAEDVTEPD